MKQKIDVIIDSGTSYFTIPDFIAFQFMSLMQKKNINCTLIDNVIMQCIHLNANDYPDIQIKINGTSYFIPKQSYISCSYKNCILRIIVYPGINMFILGLNFLQNYYTVFDHDNKRIGFVLSSLSNLRIQ